MAHLKPLRDGHERLHITQRADKHKGDGHRRERPVRRRLGLDIQLGVVVMQGVLHDLVFRLR